MARKKLSEFSAKTVLFKTLGDGYNGVSVKDSKDEKINKLDAKKLYVVKVDQGVKGRMKKGLVGIKLAPKDIPPKIKEFEKRGYSQFLIEDFVPHDQSDERYFSIERIREGNIIYYSNAGGIDIEQNKDKIKKIVIASEAWQSFVGIASSSSTPHNDEVDKVVEVLGLSIKTFNKILQFFEDQYVSFLEINPLVVQKDKYYFLDLAVEVDNTAEFFVQNGWTAQDIVGESGGKTEEERNIIELQANSQASLKMEMLNPNGSIFVMLFGGGGSIVVADEVYNQGYSKELANYSDYSGGPKEEETVIYVKNVLQSLLKSKAKKKVFIVAGTYANFTDVTVTFKGFIRAVESLKTELEKQDIKIFIRRPGPGMKKGLALINDYLSKTKMYGGVWDHKMILSDVVLKALEYLKK